MLNSRAQPDNAMDKYKYLDSYKEYLISIIITSSDILQLYKRWVGDKVISNDPTASLDCLNLLFKTKFYWEIIAFLELNNISYISYLEFSRDMKLKELLK